MKRILIVLAATAMLLPAAASAGATARGAKVEIRHTGLGSVLANGHGFTVYVFTHDARNHDRCVTVSGCVDVWPAVTTSLAPVAGPGVRRALLGTIRLPDGSRQVTYAGHPLYTYLGDGGPGETGYVGASQFGGTWYAIDAAGRIVK